MEMVFILLAIFIILMLLRVPIAVSMGLSSLVGFMLIGYNPVSYTHLTLPTNSLV